MLLLTQTAKRGWLEVVDLMPYRFHCFQIREDGFQIVVGHLAEEVPWHRCAQRSRANLALSQSLNKCRLVVITNS